MAFPLAVGPTGLWVAWGMVAASASSWTVILNVPFPNNIVGVFATNNSNYTTFGVTGLSKNGFTIEGSAGNDHWWWLAIGY